MSIKVIKKIIGLEAKVKNTPLGTAKKKPETETDRSQPDLASQESNEAAEQMAATLPTDQLVAPVAQADSADLQASSETLLPQSMAGEMSFAEVQQLTTLPTTDSTSPIHGTQWAQAASETKTDAGAAAVTSTDAATAFLAFASMAVVGGVLSSNNAAAQPDISRTVTGQLMAGPVIPGHGLKVQLFQADGTTPLGDPVDVDDDGKFTAVVKNYTGVVIAKVFPDADAYHDYTDEALGAGKDLNATLMAAGELTAGSTSITLNINPLTTVAVVKMGANPTAAKVAETNTQVGTAFGLTNLTGTTVVPAVAGGTYDSTDGLSQGELYGAVLAAMSGKDRENSDQTQTTIDQFAAGISGATLGASAQVALLQGAAAADAQVPGELRTALVDQLAPAATLPDDISGLAVANMTPLVMAKLNTAQLGSLTPAQIADLAALSSSPLGVLDAVGIAALGDDITGLSAAQLVTLTDTQLGGLTPAQVAALSNEQLAELSDAQVALLDLSQINSDQAAAMATAGNLDNLSAAQVQSLQAEAIDSVPNGILTALTAAQVAALSNEQLAALSDAQVALLDLSQINSDQAAAMATAGNLDNLSAAQVQSLQAEAIDSVPADVIDNLTSTQVANLSLQQVQALTGAQLQALATAGLLDDLAHPLTNAQLTSASPAGLGLTTLGDNSGQTGIEAGLFNEIINTQSLVTGTDATDTANKLSNIASVVDRIAAAAAGQAINSALTENDFAAIGITGVTANNLSAVLAEIAASADNGSGIASLSAIRTLIAPDAITNLSLSAGDSGESNADRLTNAASLTFSGTARKGASVSVWVDANGDNVVDNGETQTVTADANTGVFTAIATATVANGLVRATATQTDGTGTSPVSQTLVTERDTTAPTLQSATVNGDQLVLAYSQPLDADNLPDLDKLSVLLNTGTGTSPIVVSARSVNGNALILTLATPVNAGQSITVSYTDADSADNVTGALQDRAGNDVVNLSNQSVVNVTGDNRVLGVPSAISVAEAVNGLNALEASNGTVVRVQLAGTNALANDMVEVLWKKVGAGSELVTGVITSTHINTQNYIDITVPNGVILAVGDGSVNVAARVVKAGFDANASGAASLYTSDLSIVVAAQVQPAAVTFTLDADDDSGTSPSDLITAKTSGLTFNGTTVANATVEFFVDTNLDGVRQSNESLGTVVADSTGLFAKDITLTAPGRVDGQLGDSINGVHALRVRVTDSQGNVVISSQVDVTIDTVAPAPATLSLHSASDTGVSGDNITQNTQGIRLTGNTANANESILIFKDVNQNQRYDSGDILIAETTSNGQSVFDVVLAGNLQEGEHILSVQSAPDTAGNFSVALQTVKVDNSVPVLDMTTPVFAANDTVTISYAEPLDAGSVPAVGAFTVTDSSNTTHSVTAVSVNGNNVVLTLGTSLPGSGTVSVVYAPASAGASPLQDAAGNDALAFSQSGIAIDSTAPTISNVLISTAAGSYGVGDTVNISVQFDNAVQVGGDTSGLRLELDITNSGTPVTARYAGISGNHVVFQYTVAAGDSAQTGDSIGASQLKLGDATISSLSGVTLAGGPDIALSGASDLTNGGNITINSASVGGFKYSTITGNTLWLDASDSTSLYNNGALATDNGEVDEWRDKSGNENHFTNAGNASVTPNYLSAGLTGDLPAVRFDRSVSADSLTNETMVSSTRNGEWFFITDLSQGNNAALVSSSAANTTYLTGYSLFQSNSGGMLSIGATGNTTENVAQAYVAPSSGEALLSNYVFSSNATTGTINVNTFNDQGSFSSSLTNLRGNQGYEGAGVSLGSPINGWTTQPDISEVLYFDRALTTAERQSVQIGLAEKWGVTTALGTSVTAAANTDMSAVGTGSELVHQRSLGSDGVENITVAGADVVLAGGGDDVVQALDNNFRILDGGAGNDTLKFNVGGSINLTGMVSQYLDNTSGLHQLQRFEKIDISNDTADTLSLTLADVLQLSDSQSLILKGNAGDTVQLTDSGWVYAGSTLAWDGYAYTQYTNGVGSFLVTPGLTVVL